MRSTRQTNELIGLAIILIGSILLGIWAVKGTIALRNILLVLGSLLSIYYIILELGHEKLKNEISFWKLLPLILTASCFLWVLIHYFLFSIDPVTQLEELKSTWLRAFLASIVGLGTGLALRNYPNRLNLLWLGIFIAFLVLYYQYIPRALAQNKLLVPDYDHYLFHLKINTVLIGMILIAGIDGALLDYLRMVGNRWRGIMFWYLLYWLFGTVLVLWAFVYIVDSRNGISLSIILYGFWCICSLVFFIRSQIRCTKLISLLALLIAGIGLCLVLYFAFLQTTVNKGWNTLLKDVKLAVQIDRYPHWQNLAQMGYPKHDDGQYVVQNTYERVAWATAGSRAIIAYPKGVGLLAFPFAMHPNAPPKIVNYPNAPRIATHSAWVELGLSFGLPFITLIFLVLLITFAQAVCSAYPARMTVLGFIIMIISLYTVGEVSRDHGVEILFYLLALMPALILTRPRAPLQSSSSYYLGR
jgi:hypothetical protein